MFNYDDRQALETLYSIQIPFIKNSPILSPHILWKNNGTYINY